MSEKILNRLITRSRTEKFQQLPATFSLLCADTKENIEKTTASPSSTEIESTISLSFYANSKTTKLINMAMY